MKSFYKTIKRELIQDANFEASEQAQQEIFKYMNYITTLREYIPNLGIFPPPNLEK